MTAADILAKPLCALAFCWRLERRDGVTLGLTSHDRPIEAKGLCYEPAPGISPAAIIRSADAAADRCEVAGALSARAITASDLENGRWDGATLSLHLTEWTAPGELWLELAHGLLGTVERDGDSYSASLRGIGARFERPACPSTSPTCRAELGDAACTIDLRRHRHVVRAQVMEGQLLVPGLDGALFRGGRLRWLTGPRAGLTYAVAGGSQGVINPIEDQPEDELDGCLALLTEGCDKRFATCSGRFENAENFRGEPHLPGNDLLTRYPGL